LRAIDHALYAIARPVLFRMEPESAHHLALAALSAASRSRLLTSVSGWCHRHEDPRLAIETMGLRFDNPLGVAAGLDKDARAVPALHAMGFGHVEVGTVTPVPQPGNDRPRVFRLQGDAALINRLGFPSEGAAAVARRMGRWAHGARSGIVGVNLGKNKTTDAGAAAADYVKVLETIEDGDYLVVNVSSPNTPGLRDLQAAPVLRALVETVVAAEARRASMCNARARPVLVKLSPDLDEAGLDGALDAAAGAGCAGFIATNTTLARPSSLRSTSHVGETGGLSGPPLRPRSLEVVRHVFRRLGGRLVVVGVGGVSDAESAWAFVRAGAMLVQAYTGFVYGGPSFAGDVLEGLSRKLDASGLRSLGQVAGSDA
jgi:dihydroorotate dehydrogenase